jgi:hypothetical protein
VAKEPPPKIDEEPKAPFVEKVKEEYKTPIRTIPKFEDKRKEKSFGKYLRETQMEITRLITRRTAIVSIGTFIPTILIILILSFVGYDFIDRISFGLIALSFLASVFSLVIDILKGREYAEWSALGAIICYIALILIFFPLLIYTISSEVQDLTIIVFELIGFVLLVIGVTLRWTEYDEKLLDLITMTIGYWQAYEKRKALKKVFWDILILTLIVGTIRYIVEGLLGFPSRFIRFLGIVRKRLTDYIEAIIKLLSKSLVQIWNQLHWVGLVCGLLYFTSGQLQSALSIEFLLIIGFFFCLGILFTHSERISNTVNNSRVVLLKGTISAYSMLTGVKIKKEESIFCSRCLRGVHQVEFAELQHVEQTDTPPCPYCNYQNWITVT